MEEKEVKKMSYADLENAANQLSNQNLQLKSSLQELNMFNMFKKLDYLFKVMEMKECFPKNFVSASVKEIMDIMTVEKEENNEN